VKVTKKQLSNGINVYVVRYPGTKIVSSNVIVHAGGRYEDKDNFGISHFLEHVAFKGTKSYPKPGETTEIIEKIGGIVNAWTSEQATCYWNILPDEHLDIALKVLSEQVSALTLPEKEINKERGPIIEEIKRAHDDPYSFVWHNIYDAMWPNQPIAGGVLGPVENIEKFSSDDFRRYLKARYIGKNINICITSDLDEESVLKTVEKYFSQIESGERSLPKPIEKNQTKTQISLNYRDIKQAHIVLGYKTFGVEDERVPALKVMMNILATGMSSLLFKEVREKRGAAYAIQGDVDLFSDAGAALIYAGLNTEKTEEVIVAIKQILKGLREKPLTEEQVSNAKEFIKGITLYRLDGVERIANWYTQKSLLDENHLDPDEYLELLEKVTPKDIMEVASEIFKEENETLLVLGPFKDREKFAKILAES
jgi:predicted Zn-dependent peptidase